MILIPTDTEPFYTQRVTIEGSEYLLKFDYSSREDRWYLSVATIDEDFIVRGWKLVTNVMLGPRIADRRIFPGALVVLTDSLDQSPPGLDELGEGLRCQLYYFTREDIDSA